MTLKNSSRIILLEFSIIFVNVVEYFNHFIKISFLIRKVSSEHFGSGLQPDLHVPVAYVGVGSLRNCCIEEYITSCSQPPLVQVA